MSETVEVRCPVGPKRLFTKLKLGAETARMIQPANWVEFSCSDCSRRLSRERGHQVRVFHRFDFAGDLIQTLVETPQPCPAASKGPVTAATD